MLSSLELKSKLLRRGASLGDYVGVLKGSLGGIPGAQLLAAEWHESMQAQLQVCKLPCNELYLAGRVMSIKGLWHSSLTN